VAISLFNYIQIRVVATFIIGLSGDKVSISYLIRVCYAFLNNFKAIALIIVSKLYPCVIGKGYETKLSVNHTAISGLNLRTRQKLQHSRSAVILAKRSAEVNSRSTPVQVEI